MKSITGKLNTILYWVLLIMSLMFLFSVQTAFAQEEDPFKDIKPEKPVKEKSIKINENNFFFQKEFFTIYKTDSSHNNQWTVAAGFEIFKKFSSKVRDTADLDLQMRITRTETVDKPGSEKTRVEWHNAYLTFFNPLGGFGKLHLRLGHFDQPFGLEPITDTHGTLLQLSSIPNFGFKKDWGVEIFGDLSPDINYDIAYTRGSGMYYNDREQTGMFWARLGTTGKFQRETNTELGLSFARGERLSESAYRLSGSIDKLNNYRVRTERYGADYRLTKDPFTLSLEGSLGERRGLHRALIPGGIEI